MYHFIYPSKDSYIYELNTNSEKNFGGDDNLVLKKDFDGTSLNGVSRVLLHFDLTELSQSLVATTIPTSATYHLRLYEQKTSELSPTYSLATYPLSSNWEDGTGYTTQDPNSRNGVSWARRDESFDNTNWGPVLGSDIYVFSSGTGWGYSGGVLTATDAAANDDADTNLNPAIGEVYQISYEITSISEGGVFFRGGGVQTATQTTIGTYTENLIMGSTGQFVFRPSAELTATIENISLKEVFSESGSRSVLGGGTWHTSAACSQSFSYESPDVNMDVTDMVNNWLGGIDKIDNNGLILKWSGSQEDSSDYSGDINFVSSNAQSIYSPKIEVRWDAAYTGSQKSDFLITDGTKDNYLYMIGLRDEYRETETPKFRVGGRERYKTKVVTSTCDHLEVMLRSEAGGDDVWYSIDNYTGTLDWETNPENATYKCGTDFSVTDINGLSRMRAACADGRYVTMCFAGDPTSAACDHEWNDWAFLNGNNACSTTDLPNPLIPHNKGWYSIIDVETGTTLIPFSDYSKLSMDWPVYKSSYFKLNLNGFITNRLYRIILRLQLDDGRYRIFDDNFNFKVVS